MPAGSALEADTPCLLEVGPRGALLLFQAVTEGGTGAETGVGPTQQENSAEYTGRVGARRDGGGGGQALAVEPGYPGGSESTHDTISFKTTLPWATVRCMS
jgi:hypothetical protein